LLFPLSEKELRFLKESKGNLSVHNEERRTMTKSLSIGVKRGFPEEWLKKQKEPKIKKDEKGYYLYTVNENAKVYLEDFYNFLEKVEKRCMEEMKSLRERINDCDPQRQETLAYLNARKIIVEVILKNVYGYYGDDTNLGVIMSPWCFGTVILEKVESYKERLSRGQLLDSNLPEYPYYVLRYIDEIYKKTLLEVFEFPDEAFSVKWQYTEILKRYSRVLSDITATLTNIISLVKEYRYDSSGRVA
jgi:hypothetical protein